MSLFIRKLQVLLYMHVASQVCSSAGEVYDFQDTQMDVFTRQSSSRAFYKLRLAFHKLRLGRRRIGGKVGRLTHVCIRTQVSFLRGHYSRGPCGICFRKKAALKKRIVA